MSPALELHGHADMGYVSWRIGGSGFGKVHLEPLWGDGSPSGKTLCGPDVPIVGRVVRNQYSAAIGDMCRNCLETYAKKGVTNG